MKKSVLITSGRMISTLELVRILKEAGCRVLVTDCFPRYLCKFSNAVDKSFQTSPPSKDPEGFKRDILRIVEEEKIDYVIPASEEAIYVAGFADELPCGCLAFCDTRERMERVHNKYHFIKYCEELGFQVPRTELIDRQTEQVPDFCATTDFVVKPGYSRAGAHIYFRSAGEGVDDLNLPAGEDFLAQQKIEGEVLCAFAVINQGQVGFSMAYLPALKDGFFGVAFENLDHPKIKAWIDKFARESGYHGFVSFDFIEDARGDIYPIECNPRITSGIHMAPHQLLGEIILQEPGRELAPVPVEKKQAGRQRAFIGVSTMVVLIRALLGQRDTLRHVIRTILRGKEVVFSWRDPLPIFVQLPVFLGISKMSRKEGVPRTETPTWCLEYPPLKVAKEGR